MVGAIPAEVRIQTGQWNDDLGFDAARGSEGAIERWLSGDYPVIANARF